MYIWDSPSHWRTHMFQDGYIKPPTRYFYDHVSRRFVKILLFVDGHSSDSQLVSARWIAQVGKDYKVHFADRLPNALSALAMEILPLNPTNQHGWWFGHLKIQQFRALIPPFKGANSNWFKGESYVWKRLDYCYPYPKHLGSICFIVKSRFLIHNEFI